MMPNVILDQPAISVEQTQSFQVERGQLPVTIFQRGLAGSEVINLQILASPEFLKADVVIEDCEDEWDESVDADVTATADDSVFKVGTKSAKFVVAAGASANDLLATEVVSVDLSGHDQIKFWIRSTVNTSAGDLLLLLDDTASCASPVLSLSVPALTANEWKHVVIPYDRNTAGLKHIISVGLKYVTDIGAVTINIDDIRAEQAWDNVTSGGSDVALSVATSTALINQPGEYRLKCTSSAGRVRAGTYF